METVEIDRPKSGVDRALVLSKAATRAADQLEISSATLARILGVSEASVSRMRRGEYRLEPGQKPFELGALFVRLFSSLDTVLGGDSEAARRWLVAENATLGGRPLERIQTVEGLVNAAAYLDVHRARI
jgi:hypothetical protein